MKKLERALCLLTAFILTSAAGGAVAQHEHGQEASGHSHAKAQFHGGGAVMTQEFHFETVFSPNEIRLYVYDGAQNPMMAKHWKQGLVKGSVAVSFQDRNKAPITIELEHVAPGVSGGEASAHEHEHASSEEHGHDAKGDEHEANAAALWVCPMHPDQNGLSSAECAKCGMAYQPQDYLSAKIDLSGLQAGGAKAVFKLTNLSGTEEKNSTFTQKIEFTSPGDEDHHDEGHGGESHGDSHDHDSREH